jgi:hypothetical protein
MELKDQAPLTTLAHKLGDTAHVSGLAIIKKWREMAEGRPTVAFCCSIKHAGRRSRTRFALGYVLTGFQPFRARGLGRYVERFVLSAMHRTLVERGLLAARQGGRQ